MTADTTESQNLSTSRFVGRVALFVLGFVALWVIGLTVIRPWRDAAFISDVTPTAPLKLAQWEGFGAASAAPMIAAVVMLVAVVVLFFVSLVGVLGSNGKRNLVALPITLLGVLSLIFSVITIAQEPADDTGDPVVVEWAQERYGVELVGDAKLKDSPTLVLDDGTTVVVTVVESSAGSSVILTGEELGELPVIAP